MTNQILHQKTVSCVQNVRRSEAELIGLLQIIDERKAYLEHAVPSLFRYCTDKLGLTEAETCRFTQVSRKAKQVPELQIAINSGSLSVSKGSRIASVLTPDNAAAWIEKAQHSTYKELEREVVKDKPETPYKESLKPVTAAQSELRITIPQSAEALLKKVQQLYSRKAGMPLSYWQAIEKALTEAVRRHDPVEKAERSLLRKKNNGAVPASASAARQMGRRKAIPQALVHQVNLRDQGRCCFKNPLGDRCPETLWLQIHHRVSVARGGVNSLANLLTLCTAHHASLHGQDMTAKKFTPNDSGVTSPWSSRAGQAKRPTQRSRHAITLYKGLPIAD